MPLKEYITNMPMFPATARQSSFEKQMMNDQEAEPPQIYLRNYETTKVRCERA